MKKATFLGFLILLSTTYDGISSQTASGTPQPSKERKVISPGVYPHKPEEIASQEAYKKLLDLKQHPETAHDADAEASLKIQEADIEGNLEDQRNDEDKLKKDIEKIESTMKGFFGKALNVATSWLWGAGTPEEPKYSQEDLDAVRHTLNDLKEGIRKQEADLELVSKGINEATSEHEKLEKALPTLVKDGAGKAGSPTKSFLAKKDQLKAEDPMHERAQKAKLGNTSDTAAMANLAQRFLMKLDVLDKLYNTLSTKIAGFRAKISEDEGILKLMKDDPEFVQGGVTWKDKILARLIVQGNTASGLTPEQNNKLRTGLERIRKVITDEIAEYKVVVQAFEEYTHTLPALINKFRQSKIDFFKKHHEAVKTSISKANKAIVERLVEAMNSKSQLEQQLAKKSAKDPSLQKLKEQIGDLGDQIYDLRNESASFKRQSIILDQASDVRASTKEELDKAELRSKEATAVKGDQSSSSKKEGTVDEMLEALVNLTEVVKGSASDVLNPLIDSKVKGFFGSALLREVGKSGAPSAISALTGLLQTKVAQIASEGGTINQSSPQIRLLQVLNKIKEIQIQEKKKMSEEEKRKLSQTKNNLLLEIKVLKKVLDCMSTQLEPKKRIDLCEIAVREISKTAKNPQESEEDKILQGYKKGLETEASRLREQIKSNIAVSSKATNDVQRQQESQGLILDALIGVLEDSSQSRVDLYISKIEPLLPEFQYEILNRGKKKIVDWVVPYISGLLDSKLSEKLGELSQDPTKLKYHDSRVVELLTARITEKPGSPKYIELSQQIEKAYKDIMAVREDYKKKIMDVGNQRTVRNFYGFGSETETSKRQNKRAIESAKDAGKTLLEQSDAYKKGLRQPNQ